MKVPKTPPSRESNFKIISDLEAFRKIVDPLIYRATVGDRYLHWEKLGYRPVPKKGTTHAEWWAAIKLARMSLYKHLKFSDTEKKPFKIATPDPVLRLLSDADRNLSGRVTIPDQIQNPGTRDRYLMTAQIEEAITSSQLEGAATTRKVAADMLRSGRKPTDEGERMIWNNFRVMQFLRTIQNSPLTPALIAEIQQRITEGTLENPADAGRFRDGSDKGDDEVRVYGWKDEVLHTPPKSAEIAKRVEALCAFANEDPAKCEFFVHPIIRAILLHFMLAYDHPFVDGNGRTARALFYWSMLRSGYWMVEYLSISQILRQAPSKYALSYLYTETDENDTTYFVLYQLEVLLRAIGMLHDYVIEKMREIEKTQALMKNSQRFNHRQLALLGHGLRNPDGTYTVTSHSMSHQVTRQTARVDLQELVDLKLLSSLRVGKGVVYRRMPDLETRLASLKK
jgi:Fic family protein